MAAPSAVKVRRLAGQEQWLFIHLEIQAQPDTRFPHRMWVYYYRLCDKHGEGVVSLAVAEPTLERFLAKF